MHQDLGSRIALTSWQRLDKFDEFDAKRIEDDGDLVNRVSLTDVGKEVAILVLRDGSEIELKVKVGNRADFDPRR